MLCFYRNPGESVVIVAPDGTRLTITLLERNHRGARRFGIDAPEDYSIFREEAMDGSPIPRLTKPEESG